MSRSPLRAGARVVGAVVALVVVACLVIYAGSRVILGRRYALPSHAAFALNGAPDSASIERGRHLVGPIAKCTACHGGDLSGQAFINDPAFGRFVAPNLTRGVGGVGATLTDAAWELAIRHGIDTTGRGLLFMPSSDFNRMSDEDVVEIIAYLKQIPPVDHTLDPTRVGPVARALLVAGKLPIIAAARIDESQPHVPAPPVGPTPEYGAYIARIGGCEGCHRANFSGGHVAGTPPSFKAAANLTPTGIGTWTKDDFVRALRQGVTPGGVPLDSLMPVRMTKDMTDTEIDALWAYIRTMPPAPMGR
jgi:mono/diheme cytochrome c family protein